MKYFILSLFTLLLFTSQAHAWVINSDFESGTPGVEAQDSDGFFDAHTGSKYTSERAHTGSQSAKMTIIEGSDGWGDWGGEFNYRDTPAKHGQEIWYRVWLYYPSDWVFSSGPKNLRIHVQQNSGANVGYLDIFFLADRIKMQNEIASRIEFVNNPCSGGGINEFLCNNGGDGSDRVIPYNMNAKRGQWMAVEIYTKLHATPGQAVFRAWIDGEMIWEDTKSRTMINTSDESDLIFMHTTWNNGAPTTQSDYIDDVIITTDTPSNRDAYGNAYIGIGDAVFKSKPKPPTIIMP